MPRENHGIQPVYNENSKILILGSFPSVKSRENHFFYGHPQNRFWKVLANVLEENPPSTVEEKKAMLLSHGIAIWDVIESCDIEGSSDSSIKNIVPNDLNLILKSAAVRQIFTNGNVSAKLYDKYCLPITKIPAVKLPSTSPANAAYTLPKLCRSWICLTDYLK